MTQTAMSSAPAAAPVRTPRSLTSSAFCLVAALACTPPPGAPSTTDAGSESHAPRGPCDLHDDCGPADGRPGRRSEAAGVWDSAGQRLWVFGGSDAIPVQCATPAPHFLDETWVFAPRCATWRQLGGPQPPARGRHVMAFDARAQRVLLFGGRFRAGTTGSYLVYNDLWQLDLADERWSELVHTNPPTARVNAAFVVNGDATKAYLFGGNTSRSGASFTPKNDLWELDLATHAWTQLDAGVTVPAPRLWHAALFDTLRRRLVIFGGGDETAFLNDARYFRDVWAYDVVLGTWEQLHAGGDDAPLGRFWGEWVYDSEDDAYLLFGGHDDGALGNRNDLWAFSPDERRWQALRTGDTFHRPATGFCDFPPDFSIVDPEAPERRNAHVAVYTEASECPGLLTAFGKTDCGATDDVFRWNLAEGRWEELLSAREGEMCERSDSAFDCQDMCF